MTESSTRIIQSLDEIAENYRVLFCDLWGCLHDGQRALPDAVAALERFKARGGIVVLLTNSPRPAGEVANQLAQLGAPETCYDHLVSSGDAAQQAMVAGLFGRKVYHLGPQRDLPFFYYPDGTAIDVERVPLDEAESIVCTGLFDDHTETPDDYRDTILYGKTKGLKFLCANPDIIVDVGETRIYCAGAIAKAYSEAGGQSYYFGKPHSPIYDLARNKLAATEQDTIPASEILCIGDGIFTDVQGALGEDLDVVFVTGGLAAEETGTRDQKGPDPQKLADFIAQARLTPQYAIAKLR